MKIYIDNDYMCHTSNDGSMHEFDVPFFDGKCAAYIEGYRYVPQGETWTRSDGVVFNGEMIAPAVDSRILEAYQKQYEAMLPEMADMQTALETLGVTVDG
jgi:hypothetical protein